jgi:SHS2 domain-containing protein
MMTRYKHFGTTADVGVESYGRTVEEAFENQAAGMFSIMTDLRYVRGKLPFEVEVDAADIEGLLSAWLEELLFISDTKAVFLRRFVISSLGDSNLKGRAFGEEIDASRHVIKTDVKAVTHHGLEVRNDKKKVTTRVLYDI